MHKISKKDLSEAEMDTLTKSCSPTTVITASGEVQTHEEAIVYVKELDTFFTMKVLEDTPAVFIKANLCDEHGYSYVKDRISFKTVFEYSVIRKTSYQSWFLAHQRVSSSSLLAASPMTPSTEIDHSDYPPAIVSSESVDRQHQKSC